ncbi:hypothetical protein [Fibrobacter sp.]|uniref:hypothetical protein n=1 Tax=Fibrobacter sp. TaxID=35828 RepID=UPI0025C182DB|nr:hypothetical protein [Fibrobacter sp.]MBR3070950.1 hypothetical protein [Fibrobacter sp.]
MDLSILAKIIISILGKAATPAIIILLFVLFGYYIQKVRQISKCNKELRKALNTNDPLSFIQTNLPTEKFLAKNYEISKSLTLDSGEQKTTEFAEDYFNLANILSIRHINRQAMSAAAGILVGIGVLGTFIGLTIGIAGIDLENLKPGIRTLLGGMQTAFLTSVVGMILSSFYTFLEKDALNRLTRTCVKLCEKLDELYFISELEKQQILTNRQNKLFLEQVAIIVHDIKSVDDDANELTIGNMLRDIKQSNEYQIDVLNAMAENICNGLGEKFKELADAIQNPAANMANGIVEELKTAISQMANSVEATVNSITKGNLDKVSDQLGNAIQSLETFPQTMALLSEKMQNNMELLGKQVSNINTETAQVGANLADKQASLNQQSADILDKFQNGMSDTTEILKEVKKSLAEFEKLHQQAAATIEKIRNAATSVESASKNINDAQSKFVTTNNNVFEAIKRMLDKAIEDTQKTFDNIKATVNESVNLKKDFEMVQQNLGNIFEEMNNGLQDYSKAVSDNTAQIMSSFTTPMTDAIGSLKTAIDDLDSVVEQIPNKK